ncbi:MAG: phospholipase D family protein [Gemmataceae bacterium]
MDWLTILLGGLAGGLILAYLADVVVLKVRRWYRGDSGIAIHFSPKGGCVDAIVAELTRARSEILVQAYSFTNREIVNALVDAVKRGVRTSIMLDKSNEVETYTELGDLTAHGMDVHIDGAHAIAHNKVMIIDNRTVITGSFNFTRQAELENAENLLIFRNQPELAARYKDNFHSHAGHCHAPGTAAPKPSDSAPHASSFHHKRAA